MKTRWIKSVLSCLLTILVTGIICLIGGLIIIGFICECRGDEYLLGWGEVTTDTSGALIPEQVYYEIFEFDSMIGQTLDTTYTVQGSDLYRTYWTVRACSQHRYCSKHSLSVSARIVSFMPAFAAETTHVYIRPLEITSIAHPSPGDSVNYIITEDREEYECHLKVDYNRDGIINLSDLACYATSDPRPSLHELAVLGERYGEIGILMEIY